MSCLKEFAACCTNQCAWKCCRSDENDTINVHKFEHSIRKQWNNFTLWPLISERSVYLNESVPTMLKIGCSLQHFFQVIARIESKTKPSVTLTSDELTDLLEFLSNNLDENSTWKSVYEKTTPDSKFNIKLKQSEPRTFNLYIGRKYLSIDEESLNTMLCKKSYIENYVSMLEKNRKSYQSMLIKMVSHFCYDNKSLKLATDLANSKQYVRRFFDEILNFHNDCIDKEFTNEIAANFSEWFTKCVPCYIKTIMLNEADRLQSFSSREWPHDKKHINVKTLAKSGLYFTGEGDAVCCVFCNVQLHEWEANDNPILDHFEYSPKCPFLNDSKLICNVPIGDGSKVQQLFSIIPRANIYDAPDY